MSGPATPSPHATRSHQASGPGYRQLTARTFIAVVVTALIAASLALFLPSAAQAYNGGVDKTNPVALPITPPNSFVGDNTGLTSTMGPYPCTSANTQCWYNVTYWSWTPDTSGTVAIRAKSISPVNWDNTLEVWSGASASTFVTMNDDSYGLDAQVQFNFTSGTTYVIGLGGFGSASRGTATLNFLTTVPDVPGATGNVTATAGNGNATISWTDPSANALSVTSYSVYTYIGGVVQGPASTVSGTPPARTLIKAGLTNGTAYTFKVLGTNALGNSALSVDSNEVTPNAVIPAPGVPTITGTTAGNSAVTVAVAGTAGGTPVSYQITADPGGNTCTSAAAVGSCTVSGLTNGTSYTFTATATNSSGTSAASAASNTVIPGAPAAPVINSATAGNAQVTVEVGPGVGGGTVTSYRVTASPGPSQCVVTSPATSCIVTGLTNGSPYSFTATATNGVGTSADSGSFGPVTPSTGGPGVPPAPTAVAHNGSASVTVAAGSGSVPTSFTVTANPGPGTCTVTGSSGSCLVTGLTNDIPQTFTATATNGSGTSNTSAASSPATTPLASIPGTLGTPTGVPGNGGITVTVPTGTPAPTTTTVTAHPGGATCTVTVPATSCTITGLTNGTDYTFTATATNALGTSTASPASATIIPSAVGVSLTFSNLPAQIVPGQNVLFVLDATSAPRALQRSLTPRTAAGVSGTAVFKAKGATICTAIITDGRGSCAGAVNGTGTITFTASFNGTVAGVAGTATATATARVTVSNVAINYGKLTVGRCWVKMILTGKDVTAGAKITIWMQKGTKKIKLGTTRAAANKSWRFTAKVNTLKATVWAADSKSKGAKLTLRVALTKNTTVRGC